MFSSKSKRRREESEKSRKKRKIYDWSNYIDDFLPIKDLVNIVKQYSAFLHVYVEIENDNCVAGRTIQLVDNCRLPTDDELRIFEKNYIIYTPYEINYQLMDSQSQFNTNTSESFFFRYQQNYKCDVETGCNVSTPEDQKNYFNLILVDRNGLTKVNDRINYSRPLKITIWIAFSLSTSLTSSFIKNLNINACSNSRILSYINKYYPTGQSRCSGCCGKRQSQRSFSSTFIITSRSDLVSVEIRVGVDLWLEAIKRFLYD